MSDVRRYNPPVVGEGYLRSGRTSIAYAKMTHERAGRWIRYKTFTDREKLLRASLKEIAQEIREDIKLIASTGDWPETVENLERQAKALDALTL